MFSDNWHHRFCLPWAMADVEHDSSHGCAVWVDVAGSRERPSDDALLETREPELDDWSKDSIEDRLKEWSEESTED